MDYETYLTMATLFLDTYKSYIDEIEKAKSAIVFSCEYSYRVEWQRTGHSRIKTFGFDFINDYLIKLPSREETPNVLFCTPEKVAPFLRSIAKNVEQTLTMKRYDMYREVMKEGKI